MADLAAMFKALGDPNRLAIFTFICCCGADVEIDEQSGDCCRISETCVGDVCCRFDVAPSTVSHHLKELRTAGLVDMERRGRWVYVNVNKNALNALRAFAENPGAGAACGAPASATEC